MLNSSNFEGNFNSFYFFLEHFDTSDVSSLIQIQIYRFPIYNHVKCQKAFFCHKTHFIFYIVFLCDTPKFRSLWGCNVKLGFEGAPAKLFWFFVDRLSFDVSNICCHLQRSVKCKTYMVLKGDSCNLYDVLDCCKMYKKCNALNSKPYKDIFKGLQNYYGKEILIFHAKIYIVKNITMQISWLSIKGTCSS